MSMIGEFGVCPKDSYQELKNFIENGKCVKTETLIKKIYTEVENSAAKLENGKCSGEVFIALFHYLKTAYGVDVRRDLGCFGEKWRDATGDFDIIVFFEKDQILSLENAVDFNELAQFINDFYQMDYGDTGQIACSVLFNNLKYAGEDTVLIWHLF